MGCACCKKDEEETQGKTPGYDDEDSWLIVTEETEEPEFDRILRDCKDKQKYYTDEDFIADKSSLIKDWNENHAEVRNCKIAKWD